MKSSRYHEQQMIPLTPQGQGRDQGHDYNLDSNELACARHPAEEVRFVCKQCGVVVCTVCKLLEHQGHVTKGVAEAANEMRQNIAQLMQSQVRLSIYMHARLYTVIARGFGSVVKHSIADPGIASSIPPQSN